MPRTYEHQSNVHVKGYQIFWCKENDAHQCFSQAVGCDFMVHVNGNCFMLILINFREVYDSNCVEFVTGTRAALCVEYFLLVWQWRNIWHFPSLSIWRDLSSSSWWKFCRICFRTHNFLLLWCYCNAWHECPKIILFRMQWGHYILWTALWKISDSIAHSVVGINLQSIKPHWGLSLKLCILNFNVSKLIYVLVVCQ